MSGFSTQGILLRRIEYGDYDLIVTYFTQSMGRVSVVAKNAKKSVKRFAGALDPFSLMHIYCTLPKKRKGLPVLDYVEMINPFAKIRMNTAKTGYASYWLELINSWMEQGKAQPEIFYLLSYVLDALNSGGVEKEVLSLLFQIRFMSFSGFTPNITSCGICSAPVDEICQNRIVFDFAECVILCDKCCSTRKNGVNPRGPGYRVSVSKGTLKQLAWINTRDIKRTGVIKFPGFAVKEGEHLLESFIPCHIGREMKSLMFLKRIRGQFQKGC
ncbi:MAG: DNA repair protein RecO [Thermodesulfobacteriota bacterium]|nr:DNA repair protein RecO [Thermodesulfobacteriota bacterium]